MHYMVTPLDITSFMQKRNSSDIEIPLSIQKQVITAFTNHFMKIESMLTNKNKLAKDSK